MGRRQTACRACASIKSLCSKETPCSRCKRLSLRCSLNLPRSQDGVAAYKTQGSRTWHSKTSTGCKNCQTRRKKCDELYPVCGDCSRLGLPCVPRDRKKAIDTERTLVESRPVGFAGQVVDDDDLVPSFDWISVIDEEYQNEYSTKGTSLANSSALDVQPESRASDYVCAGESASLPSTALANLAGITLTSLAGWTIGERHLLNHFLQYVARSLVLVEDEENPFIATIVPLALGNSTVSHALLALSACHLSRTYPDFERNLLRHRSLALRCLKDELKTSKDNLPPLAATMLLCLLEICAGDSRRWLLYLHGAKALLASMGGPETPKAPMDFLVDLYDYLCSVAAITSDKVPRPFSRNFGLLAPGASGIHPLFGIASDLYTILARINQLSLNHDSLPNTSERSLAQESFKAEAKAIELSLQSWSPPGDRDDRPDMIESTAAAFAVQWATMLRLREIAPLNTDGKYSQTKGPEEHILSALSLIRSGSQNEARMLFPIFMAGVSSTTKASRLTLEFRVSLMKTTIGFGNIASAHQILDEMWRRINNGEQCQWRHLMRQMAPGMVLL